MEEQGCHLVRDVRVGVVRDKVLPKTGVRGECDGAGDGPGRRGEENALANAVVDNAYDEHGCSDE